MPPCVESIDRQLGQAFWTRTLLHPTEAQWQADVAGALVVEKRCFAGCK